MSEFTSGNLYLKEFNEKIEEFMKRKDVSFYIRNVNEKWSAIFLDKHRLEKNETIKFLKEISKIVPILHFENAEDHGWGYNIFSDDELLLSKIITN